MSRLGRIAAITLCGLAMPLAVSLPAQAETIFLKCGDGTMSIDMTNHTVDGKPANITPLQIE